MLFIVQMLLCLYDFGKGAFALCCRFCEAFIGYLPTRQRRCDTSLGALAALASLFVLVVSADPNFLQILN